MNKKKNPRKGQISNLHAWLLSFIYGLLTLLAAAAATRVPFYVATGDYGRLAGLLLFGLVVTAGLIDNLQMHLHLWRGVNKMSTPTQAARIIQQ